MLPFANTFYPFYYFAGLLGIGPRTFIDTGAYLGKFLMFAVPYTAFAIQTNSYIKFKKISWNDDAGKWAEGTKALDYIDVDYKEIESTEIPCIENSPVLKLIDTKGTQKSLVINDFWI